MEERRRVLAMANVLRSGRRVITKWTRWCAVRARPGTDGHTPMERSTSPHQSVCCRVREPFSPPDTRTLSFRVRRREHVAAAMEPFGPDAEHQAAHGACEAGGQCYHVTLRCFISPQDDISKSSHSHHQTRPGRVTYTTVLRPRSAFRSRDRTQASDWLIFP